MKITQDTKIKDIIPEGFELADVHIGITTDFNPDAPKMFLYLKKAEEHKFHPIGCEW